MLVASIVRVLSASIDMSPPLDSVEEVTVAVTVLRTSLRTTMPPLASAFESLMLMLGMWLATVS